jgi:hypothetical protein
MHHSEIMMQTNKIPLTAGTDYYSFDVIIVYKE